MRIRARALALGLLAVCLLVGFAAAFAAASTAGAGASATTTTSDPPQTTEPPPAEPPPTAPPAPTPAPIAFGVTVGGVRVGGLMPERATLIVRRSFDRPLVIVVNPIRTIRLAPRALAARPNVPKAIRRARVARPGATVPLDVEVPLPRVRTFVARLGRELDQEPVDAHIELTGIKPHPVASQEGRRVKRLLNGRAIRAALATNSRTPIQLAIDVRKPKVATAELGLAIVILRTSNKLLLFSGTKFVRTFGIATGQAAYPTPLGDFEIVTKQRDPWWYPPPSKWAADSQAIPPGPGNPLGTRWMGLSAPYVGIHGTPDAASIGYSASHGCIRMRIPDAEWLFNHVKVGTPVFIISR